MIPGPVQLHERIIKAMARQMIGHRTKEFSEILEYCTEMLKKLFGTKHDVFIISGSGTAGMEAAIASFSKVKRITCIDNGKFGDRLGKIAERYTNVDVVRFEWGKSIDLDEVEKSLAEGSGALAFVHNETSTGILNPAKELAKLAKELGVDGIVAPSTRPERLKEIKEIVGEIPIISPGIGAQGGDLEKVLEILSDDDYIIVGRSIYNSENPKESAKMYKEKL